MEEACVALQISRATLERRVSADEVPSKKEGKNRFVWISGDGVSEQLLQIKEEIRLLRTQLGDLRQERIPIRKPTTTSPPQKKRRGDCVRTLHDPSEWAPALQQRIKSAGSIASYAKEIGVAASQVSRWRSGHRRPPAEMIARFRQTS